MISYVACILMQDQTTHGTLFNPFRGVHDFVRSVHLDARPNRARNVIEPFRGVCDFVQLVARYDSHYQLIFLFLAQTFTSFGVAVK